MSYRSNTPIVISVLLGVGLLYSRVDFVKSDCFLAKENNQIVMSQGDCLSRHSPCSTFKIALSLMGYNEGLLLDQSHPKWAFRDGYVDYLDNWREFHTPSKWMQNSCVWFSHIITKQLGMDKFCDYVEKFDYGNQDVSGDFGQDNGLTSAWLSSSLKISAEEQIAFLQKLIDGKLPVSKRSHEMTKEILYVECLKDDYKLYAKTGSGCLRFQDRAGKIKDSQIGWYVGWIQNAKHTIVFTQYIQDMQKAYGGPRAREAAKEKLLTLIETGFN